MANSGSRFSSALDEVLARVRQAALDATQVGGELIQDQARQNAQTSPGPRNITGRLVEGIRAGNAEADGEGHFECRVVSSVIYAAVQEEGRIIFPSNVSQLHWYGPDDPRPWTSWPPPTDRGWYSGTFHRGNFVEIKPHPYFEPAFGTGPRGAGEAVHAEYAQRIGRALEGGY